MNEGQFGARLTSDGSAFGLGNLVDTLRFAHPACYFPASFFIAALIDNAASS